MPYTINFSFLDLVEGLLAVILLSIGYCRPRLGRSLIHAVPRWTVPFHRSPALLVLTAFALPIALRLLLLPVDPAPTPVVMEEYNNLLQAQTYALGRLYNPVHPLAQVLQAPQVIQWPHYMSTRPPLAGLFLWIGQASVGSPFLGNLLGVGLTAAALSWMLVEWLPRRWAVLGTIVVVCTFCLFGYWVNSFWCPTPNVLGAAVLLALVPRIERGPRLWHAALFVLSMALLAGIRPYENGIYVVTILVWLAVRFNQPPRRAMRGEATIRFALPVALGGLLVALGLGWYNLATTGHVATMPYAIWRLAQCRVPAFLWQPILAHSFEPLYRNAAKFAEWEVSVVQPIKDGGLAGITALLARHVVTLRDQLGPMLLLPLLCWSPHAFGTRVRPAVFVAATFILIALLFASWTYFGLPIKLLLLAVLYLRWRNANERLPVVLIVVGLLATSVSSFYMNIYFAVFMPPLILLAVGGLQHLHAWQRGRGAGVAGMAVFGILFLVFFQTLSYWGGDPVAGMRMTRFDQLPFKEPREVYRLLRDEPGRQLVVVRNLAPGKSIPEMVWNSPDIDRQRIIWVRDIRPEWTVSAIAYFRPRKVWLVEMLRLKGLPEDALGIRVKPYPVAALPAPVPIAHLPMPDRAAAEKLGIGGR